MTGRNQRNIETEADPVGAETEDSVNALATRALRVLVSRRAGQKQAMSRRHLEALEDAISNADPFRRYEVVDAMLASGIERDEICDIYVPEIARRMGDAWCENDMSFADVTIGSARLQALLRDIDRERDAAIATSRGSVAVMVLADEYHTLGAMVLTSQLRRLGISVRLVLGRPAGEVRRLVRENSFDAILVSVSLSGDLAQTRAILDHLREDTEGNVPLIVGGSVLDLGEEKVKALTGADHATNDPHVAIEVGGIAERLLGDA